MEKCLETASGMFDSKEGPLFASPRLGSNAMSMEVALNRADRVYRPGDLVTGVIRVRTKGGLSHGGITVNLSGRVTFIMSSKSVGMIDSIYNSLKPITLADYTTQVCKSADLTGSLLGRNLQEVLLFFVECPNTQKLLPSPDSFVITPDGIEITSKKSSKPVPKFKMSGKIDSKVCAITQPFTGHIIIDECEVAIKSIELQLLRVETVGSAEGFSKERTEIQNIQIGDGDVPRNFQIDIHMIFPRLFSCRTVQERTYKVEFDITLVVLFEDGRNITENFPITLVREWGS